MPTPPILEVSTIDWTYEDVAAELEQLAMLEDLEEQARPSISDLPAVLFDDDLARLAEELDQLAEAEAR